jgi:type I restriction enzyme, S subunit
MVLLRDVVEPRTGSRNPTIAPEVPFTYVEVAAIDNEEKRITGARVLRGSEAPSRARKLVRKNDVLVSTVRPNLNAVAVVPAELDGQVASTGFCVLRAKQCVLPEFLYFYARSKEFVEGLCKLVAGAMYPAVTDSQVLDQALPLPSLPEQRHIVDLLARAEGIVRLRREAQQKAAALIPAIFVDMFGDPATNPLQWPVVPLGDVLASVDYGSSTKASPTGAGLPIIRMGNVTTAGDLDLDDLKFVELSEGDVERFRLRVGDLLFNRTNSKELVGKTGMWNESLDAVVASYFIRLRVRPDVAVPSYLWAWMNSRHMKRVLFDTARGAIGQANINSKELRAFAVAVPPLERQQAFDTRVQEIRSICGQQAAALIRATATFDSLLSRAFH